MTDKFILNWDLDGLVNEQRYYRSTIPIDTLLPPSPTVILNSEVRSYIDLEVEPGITYYLRVSAVRNGVEKFSQEVVKQISIADPLWASVRALIYAEAENYPSTEFVNQKVSGASISASSGVSIINTVPPIYDEGVIYFNGNNATITIDYAPVRNPYTQEAFVRIPKNPTTSNWYARIFNEHVGISSDAGSKNNFRLIIDGNLQGPSSYIPDETNTHVCLMCGNGIARFYVDGVKVHESAYFGNVNGQVFGGGTAGQQFNGYMSGLRCTPGFRYDLNGFTAPTSKLPNF